ncbi:MAG: PEGA domain-containing protein [Lentisphaeria bacterium]|nr:PEGA domain-containing protein [Lentisphaeria bacterium]
MKKFIFFEILIATVAGFFLSGCSFGAPQQQNFSVTAVPENASIYINGRKIRSGQVVTVKRNKELSIAVSAPGYYSEQRTVGKILSKYGMIDGVAGCFLLIPWAGLLADGAWELEQESIFLELQKK